MNAIELRNVTKGYPLFKVDNISTDVKQGFITGLIGPNGAGKSTLIRMITGLIHPDRGTVRTLGSENPSGDVAVKQRLGIVSDECFYYEHLTIREMSRLIAPFTVAGTMPCSRVIWNNLNCLRKRKSRIYPKA